jgi:hypothetical protein
MSSHGWPSLEIERSVRSQTAVVAGSLLVLVVAPLMAAIPISIGVAIAAAAMAFGLVSYWRMGWLGGARAILRARWMTEDVWRVWERDGVDLTASLLPESRVLGRLILLRFRTDAGCRRLLFWGDDLPSDVRRRLLMRLRQYAASEAMSASKADPDSVR